jgi:hypothetical protein
MTNEKDDNMKITEPYSRPSVAYGGCAMGWALEFDPVVMKLVSEVVERQCYHGKNKRGQKITEFTIEELAEVIADIMLRVLLYAGQRDILKIKPDLDTSQATRIPEQSSKILQEDPV